MSLLGAISNSLSGLSAIQADMQVISGNVGNAQNPNYTKKTINLASDPIAGGVVVTGYVRNTNTNLSTLLQQSAGESNLLSTQKDYLGQIQDLLGSSQNSPRLTTVMSDFAAAWRQLAAAPEDTSQQQDLVFKAENLANEVNRLSTGLQQITINLKNDMQSAVDELNTTLTTINDLNNKIVAAQSSGQGNSVNNLLDQRDAAIVELSGLLNVRVLQRSQNTIGIYTPGGMSLLDTGPTQFDWDGTQITIDGTSTDVTSQLTGGKIEGLAGMLDQGSSSATLNDPGKASVYKLQQQLTSLVTLFTSGSGTFATAYNTPTGTSGELASGFFTGTAPGNFAVASALVDGSKTVKQSAVSAIAADMDVNTRTVTAAGATVNNLSYTDYTDYIISRHNQNTKNIGDQADVAQSQHDDYQQRLQSSVGVNIDDELAHLTQLQNNYSATAHILQVIQEMFQVIQQIG
ncbi:MAG TPA: flagellar hook-associated protein FlgK [Alphaproteobacteria bacterium]|nr:flagellar hook-associated protein FlgK [Alphaproteobacteria bacterium]